MATTFGGRSCVDPATLYSECLAARLPTDWAGRPNSFALTAGREPGRGHVLLRLADLSALDATSDHDLTFLGGDSRHAVTFKHVTLLRYECISPGGPGDPAAVFLCEVVDRRHFLQKAFFAGGYRAYNVTLADGTGSQTVTLNTGSPWEWDEVLADLSGLLGIGTVSVPFAPDGTPANLIYRGAVWDALNDVLARLACVLTYDPTDDTFTAVRLGDSPEDPLTAIESSADYLGRTWDGYSGEGARAWRPEKVRVRFLRRPQPTMTGGESPYHTVDVTLPAAAGVKADTVELLDDDLAAVGATGAPSNAAALATRAQERADDWLRQRAGVGRPFVRAWRDVQPLALRAVGQSVSKVVFDDRGEELRTWAVAVTARDLEGWRPLADYPPWWPFEPPASTWKQPVHAATTAAGTLSTSFAAGQQIDGVNLLAGHRILVKNQTNEAQNGIYVVNASGAPTRATDADTGDDLLGAVVEVKYGVVNGRTIWLSATDALTVAVGTTPLPWVRVYPDLTTQELDGNPSYTTTTLQFDQADGFTVAATATPGVVRVDMAAAGATQVGIVSTTTQTFAGAKTFTSDVAIGGTLGVTGTATFAANVTGQTSTDPTSLTSVLAFGNASLQQIKGYTARWSFLQGGVSVIPVAGITDREIGVTPGAIYISDDTGPGGFVFGRVAGVNTDNNAAFSKPGVAAYLSGNSTDTTPNAAFYVMDGGYAIGRRGALATTVQFGVYGTIAPGATVTGGIITAIGSGTFLADPGNGLAPGSYP
jgi:hypothetical protein